MKKFYSLVALILIPSSMGLVLPTVKAAVVAEDTKYKGTATCTAEVVKSDGKTETKTFTCTVSGEASKESAESNLKAAILAQVSAANGKVKGSISVSVSAQR